MSAETKNAEAVSDDVLAARRLTLAFSSGLGSAAWRQYMIEGAYDNGQEVTQFLTAIAVGRGLPVIDDDELEDLFSDAIRGVSVMDMGFDAYAKACVKALRGIGR
jgi:hypothetical protein